MFSILKAMFSFNKHTKIERYIGSFFLVTIPLIAMTLISIYTRITLDNNQMTNQAVYTTSLTFSRTQNTATVQGVYVNKEHTRGMVLFKLNSPELMPSRASDYSVFTRAVTPKMANENIKSLPSGTIYVFGTSGYVGLYFVNNDTFASQIFKSTIRVSKELVNVADAGLSNSQSASTYQRFDQADIYYNLGGEKATVNKALSAKEFSAQDFYTEAFGSSDDEEVRKQLNDDLSNLATYRKQMNEYRERISQMAVDGVGVNIPELPVEIKDDKFVQQKDGTFTMESPYTFKGGLNFKWQDMDYREGYFKQIDSIELNPDKLTLTKFLQKLANDRNGTEGVSVPTYDQSQFTMTDGQDFQTYVTNMGNQTLLKNMTTAVTQYVTTVNNYISLKAQYQQTDMLKLLQQDLTLDAAISDVSSESGQHFQFYN